MTFAQALRLAALLCVVAAPGAVHSAGGAARPPPRPCGDGSEPCAAPASPAVVTCRRIEAAAAEAALDMGFFARLLWQESRFDPTAISPAGAQGIAQFMPGTARLRGLEDPFDPEEAIAASARYLADLERRFGNLGLAAAAYNAGEAGASRWLSGAARLPGETRAYVLTITGHRAAAWRASPPPEPDLALDPDRPFRAACVAMARTRGGVPAMERALEPWAVVVAGQATREAAVRRARTLIHGPDAPLSGERIDHTHERLPGMAAPRHFAQVGRSSRAGADALCARLRARGVGCIVRRN